MIVFFPACSSNDSVKEYFRNHGLSYPVDVSAVVLLGINYVGIEREELLSPGAREAVEDGIIFIKQYFKKQDVQTLMPGINAAVVSKPVLFRDESGGVGLMVKVTGFGTDTPDSRLPQAAEWVGKDSHFWKTANFAYFNRNDFYKWQFGGWVY